MGLFTARRERQAADSESEAAEREYWALDDQLRELHGRLAVEAGSEQRFRILLRMSDAEQAQARLHDQAFGAERLPHNGVRMDAAQSMLWSACLYRLLADVEKAVTYPRLGRRDTTIDLERCAGAVLDRMATTPDLAERMALLPELAEAVAPKVGNDAAETVYRVPWPGRVEA